MEITQSLHRAMQQTPNRPATICAGRVRTVRDSYDRIARLAGALRGLGIADGDRVAILSLNSDRYHETLFGVAWAGAVVVPVNIRWSPTEISYSLEECGASVLVVDDAFAPMVPALRQLWSGLQTVIFGGDRPTPEGMVGYEDLVANATPTEDARRGGSDLFGLFYTGGTTGHPKGVMLSHDNLLTSSLGALAAGFLEPRGRVLHAAPMFHLADIALWIGGNLVGSTHVTVPFFEPTAVLAALTEHAIDDTLLVPTMIQMLVDHPSAPDFDLSGVKHLLYGASPVSEAVLSRARALFSNAGFTQAYGMTELAPVATLLLPPDHEFATLRRSAGRAAPHVELRIVDSEDRGLPLGEVGEVVVRGDNMMLGYWNRPEDTAEALRGGWMHTGDGGYLDENGYLFIVDRIKDMIITGGENVYSAEVENALAMHPAVASCAVIGVPDDRFGERVHGVIVLRPGADATEKELREFCRDRIAGYKLPRSVAFVEALPISAAGKVLKRELRKQEWGEGVVQVS